MHLYELNPANDSQEYQKVQSVFKASCPSNNIVKIERVQNPALYATYAIRKKKMDEGNGSKEMSLFHGTTGENCKMINHTGFNRGFHGRNGKQKKSVRGSLVMARDFHAHARSLNTALTTSRAWGSLGWPRVQLKPAFYMVT